MPVFPVGQSDIMPRMRAYLTRAGYGALVSEAPNEIAVLAREVYLYGLESAAPVALGFDCGPDNFPSPVPEPLEGCRSYTLMFFSLGARFDEAVEKLLDKGETLRGVLLDAWGSEAVEALAESIDARLRHDRGDGSIRFAPGYSGYDVRNNFDWFAAIVDNNLASDDKINLSNFSVNSETGIITPRKSIVCAVGWRDV